MLTNHVRFRHKRRVHNIDMGAERIGLGISDLLPARRPVRRRLDGVFPARGRS